MGSFGHESYEGKHSPDSAKFENYIFGKIEFGKFAAQVRTSELAILDPAKQDEAQLKENLERFVENFLTPENLNDTQKATLLDAALWRMFENKKARDAAFAFLGKTNIPTWTFLAFVLGRFTKTDPTISERLDASKDVDPTITDRLNRFPYGLKTPPSYEESLRLKSLRLIRDGQYQRFSYRVASGEFIVRGSRPLPIGDSSEDSLVEHKLGIFVEKITVTPDEDGWVTQRVTLRNLYVSNSPSSLDIQTWGSVSSSDVLKKIQEKLGQIRVTLIFEEDGHHVKTEDAQKVIAMIRNLSRSDSAFGGARMAAGVSWNTGLVSSALSTSKITEQDIPDKRVAPFLPFF